MVSSMNKSINDTSNEDEDTYQVLEKLDNILKRSENILVQKNHEIWVSDEKAEEGSKIVKKEIIYVSGLYEIFDEILVNAVDNKQRDSTMTSIEDDINREKGEIKMCNDGRGIPIRKWTEDESIHIPTLTFGKLLTSDNFNDNQKRISDVRNGYDVKVTNILYSFYLYLLLLKRRRIYLDLNNNMRDPQDAIINKTSDNPNKFIRITFTPDLKMDKFDDDLVSFFKRHAYDVAVSTGCKIDATILNEFATDTHSCSYALFNHFVHCFNNQHKMIKEFPLSDVIFCSIEAFNQQISRIDTLMFRYLPALSGKFDSMLNDVLRNHVFEAKTKSNHACTLKKQKYIELVTALCSTNKTS
ncbi:unnamed protein product [Rotaria socialis]|uniref:DNA topoisomerase (ATP-hydrolyzing) n=2 Tax=Rotaria socialis TaxID=392032 RepID=A0A819ZJ46_9BILA|nr:unnamed protein product [Rotaria socialis]CAF4241880.1 unnamed protein product [Rotaria socialis]